MSYRLIVGASTGLGASLLSLYSDDSSVNTIGASRSVPPATRDYPGRYLLLDVSSAASIDAFCQELVASNITFSSVIYCASAWGESGPLEADKAMPFLIAGPLGFLRLVSALIHFHLLRLGCMVISIGSTATLKNDSVFVGSNTPLYAMAKEMQRFASFEFQRQHTSAYRFTTVTVGGIGPDRIKPQDIKQLIDCIEGLSEECRPVEIIMPSRTDF